MTTPVSTQEIPTNPMVLFEILGNLQIRIAAQMKTIAEYNQILNTLQAGLINYAKVPRDRNQEGTPDQTGKLLVARIE